MLKIQTKMKILSFLIGSLMAQGPAPEPAPEPTKKTNILFINMNRATIQVTIKVSVETVFIPR